MGQSTTYNLTINVSSTVSGYLNIAVDAVHGGWPNTLVNYQFGRDGTQEGLYITIPSDLEQYRPIGWSGIITTPPVAFRFLIAIRETGPNLIITGTGGDLFRDYLRFCRIPGTVSTNCSVPIAIYVALKPSSVLKSDNFSPQYIQSYGNKTNANVRATTDGTLSYDNKALTSDNDVLNDVTVVTMPSLSNSNGQFMFEITLTNNDGVISTSYNVALCPNIVGITNDANNIYVTTDTAVPNIGIQQYFASTPVTVPNNLKFIATYPSSNEVILTPSLDSPLASFINPNESFTVTFFVFVSITE